MVCKRLLWTGVRPYSATKATTSYAVVLFDAVHNVQQRFVFITVHLQVPHTVVTNAISFDVQSHLTRQTCPPQCTYA